MTGENVATNTTLRHDDQIPSMQIIVSRRWPIETSKFVMETRNLPRLK